MPTPQGVLLRATIPIPSISIVPIIIAAIITRPRIGDTRTIASPFARTTSAKISTRCSGLRFSGCYDQDIVPNAFEPDGIQASRNANGFRPDSSYARFVPTGKERGNETPNFVK